MKQDSIEKLNTNIEQLLQQEDKPFTFVEAAEYLGVSKSHLYKLTSKNLIVHFKPAGKKIYFKKNDLNSYLFSFGKRGTYSFIRFIENCCII